MLAVKMGSLAILVCLITLLATDLRLFGGSAGAYPAVLLTLLATLLPLHAASEFAKQKGAAWLPSLPGTFPMQLRLVSFLVLWIVAIWALPHAGFIASIAGALSASLLILRISSWWKVVPLSCLAAVSIFALVERVLYVPMPRSIIEDEVSSFLFRLAQGG